MSDESVLAQVADPEAIESAIIEENVEGQVETPPAEAEETEEAKKSKTAIRRERDKAHRVRLQADRDAAVDRANAAEGSKARILDAANSKAAPKEDDYPDPFEFGAAKALWRDRHEQATGEANKAGEVATAAKREAEEITARERAVIEQSWTAQREEALTRYADYAQVALSADVPLSDAVADLVMTSDVGGDVLYHLGMNRELAAQIAKLSQVEAARAIGRIEASLSQPKPRTQTTAPDPINPVRGSAGASRDPAKMNFKEFKAYRESGGKL